MVKLHLGAFDQVVPGWVNTDITPHLWIARVPGLAAAMAWAGLMGEGPAAQHRLAQHRAGVFRKLRRLDATRRFPFADASVDAIHISHMLSNLTRAGAARCLAECYRVLKVGGVLRISTLDLDRAVREYDAGEPDVFMDLVFDLETSGRAKNRHWWHYNEKSLGAALSKAGFGKCVRCEFRQGSCPDVELVDTRRGSLFMEGVKGF